MMLETEAQLSCTSLKFRQRLQCSLCVLYVMLDTVAVAVPLHLMRV